MSQQKMMPTFEDVMGCQTAVYEWADSYDSKVRRSLTLNFVALTMDRTGTVCASALHLH